MPSRSAAEHRFWGAMKSHPAEAKSKGISQSTVQEFLHADKGRYQHGGLVGKSRHPDVPQARLPFLR